MEKSFEEALRFRDDKWGTSGYIENELESPSAIANAAKRKYTDMTSSFGITKVVISYPTRVRRRRLLP